MNFLRNSAVRVLRGYRHSALWCAQGGKMYLRAHGRLAPHYISSGAYLDH